MTDWQEGRGMERYKVGASNDVKRRLRQFQTGNLDIKWVAEFKVSRYLQAEVYAHGILGEHRIYHEVAQEWFAAPKETIIQACQEAAVIFRPNSTTTSSSASATSTSTTGPTTSTPVVPTTSTIPSTSFNPNKND